MLDAGGSRRGRIGYQLTGGLQMTGFQVSRTRLLLAACALVAVLIGVASASADRGPAQTLTFTRCGLTPQACADRMRHRRPAARLRPPERREGAHRRRPRPRGRHPARRAVLQLRRAWRRAVDYLQFRGASTLWHALNQHFDIIGFDPRGVGQSTPGIDCQVNQETDGIYSQPFTTPFNLDENALVAEGAALHQGLPEGERRHPVARLDRQRCPRHGPDPAGCSARAS